MLTLALDIHPIKAEDGTTKYPWTMFHHDLRHTGFSLSSAPSTNDILWTFETGDRIVSSPAVVNGKVFIGSMDKKMYAIDQFDGTLVWSVSLDHSIFYGSPAVYGNKIFVTVSGEIFAFDENTGDIIWSRVLGIADQSSPAVVDGMVFVCSVSGTDVGQAGNIFALDATTGSVIWRYLDETGGVWSSPAVADGMVFLQDIFGNVFALNQSTGDLIWINEIGYGTIISSPAVSGGRVFVGSTVRVNGNPSEGFLYALDEYTGSILWQSPTDGSIYSSPAVAYGNVFVGSYDGKIYAFNEINGNIIWTFQTGPEPKLGIASSPAVADGKVFVGSEDYNLYALDAATGTKIWSYATGHWVDSSPAVADGAVYVGSLDSKVYAFGSPEPPSPVEATQELIETIEAWNLPRGTENSLKTKLKVAIHMLDIGKENGAIRELTAFIDRVEMLREKTLTNEQADYLIAEAQTIVNLING